MKKKYLLAIILALAMGTAACASEPNQGTTPAGDIAQPESFKAEVPKIETSGTDASKTGNDSIYTSKPETLGAETSKTENNGTNTSKPEPSDPHVSGKEETEQIDMEEIPQGDPILGIVEKFENDIIVIRDSDDEDLVYYFSTKNAQIIEGDTPIAAGEEVAITYQGVMGSKDNPGTAEKIVPTSMMYNTN